MAPDLQRSISRRRCIQLIALATPGWFFSRIVTGEGRYPNRPIRCIIPFPVGGTSDLLARLVGAQLGEALGQPIVVESRPGAAGGIAMDYATRAAADGYTLFLASNGTNVVLRNHRRTSALDLQLWFTPVAKLVSLPIVIVASRTLGAATLPAMLERASRAPDALAFATSDVGSTSHLAASLLFRRAGVKLVHVPYAGTALAVKDVLGGEVQLLFTHLGTVASLLRSGRLLALAVTGNHRMPAFPDVPTVAESGFPGFDVTTWHGVLVPVGTPPEIVVRLHGELARIMRLPEMRERVTALGMEPDEGTPEQFAAELAVDVEQAAKFILDAGISAD
jgi:tripartite-type tricarboxylate transporter receptor subunit TctC